jgi:hypothetical protein
MADAPIDEATEQFLEAAAYDLQRQLGIAGDVEMMGIGQSPSGIGLRARVRVADHQIDVDGYGATILEAHADLCRRVAEPTLASAFRQLVDG